MLLPLSRRSLLLSILGLVLGVLLLGATTFVLRMKRAVPADVLPASATKALFVRMAGDDVRAFARLYPSLRTLPADAASGAVVAVLAHAAGEEWVLFPAPGASVSIPDTERGNVGTQRLLASDKAVFPLLSGTEDRLQSFDAFRQLSARLGEDASFTYVALDALRRVRGTELDDWLTGHLANVGFAAFLHQGDTWTLTLLAPGWRAWAPLTRSRIPVSAPPAFLLSLSEPRQQGEAFFASFPSAMQGILQGLLLQKIQDALGSDVGVQSDLLPLFARSATFVTDGTYALLDGMNTAAGLDDRLRALHASFAHTLPAMVVSRHAFDQGFDATVIASDPSAIRRSEEKTNGWLVRATMSAGSGRSLLTAARQNRFLLSTAPAWAREAMADEQGQLVTLPSSLHPATDSPVAGGLLDLGSLPSFAAAFPIFTLQSDFLPFLTQPSGVLLWSMEQGGDLRSFTVRVIP